MLVDFEGTSSDLQQLAQTFANAVKATQPVVGTLLVPPSSGAAVPALSNRQNGEGPGLFDIIEAGEPAVAAPAQAPAAKPQNGSKKKKLRTPNPISDLDLTSGPKPFKEYYEEHAPKDHSKRYLVVAHWLREYRNIAEVGADHVYTCYRFLGMAVPDDVLSVFRGLKKQAWVEAGSSPGTFRINHIGENQLTQAKGTE
jgi:hypothetical protein